MRNANILLVDNRKTTIENIKKSFLEIDSKHTLFSAENENEAWLMLDGTHKINPVPKIVLIDVRNKFIECNTKSSGSEIDFNLCNYRFG